MFADGQTNRTIMMRLTFILAFLIFPSAAATAQDAESDANPFGSPSENTEAKTKWTPTHPDGDTPAERMLSLAHTVSLPRFDRAELYAVSFPDRNGDEWPKEEPTEKTFPVRPYGLYADIHSHATLTGDACDNLRAAWQSLAFDRHGGAFCHSPAYGLRLYRDDQLLFETTAYSIPPTPFVGTTLPVMLDSTGGSPEIFTPSTRWVFTLWSSVAGLIFAVLGYVIG